MPTTRSQARKQRTLDHFFTPKKSPKNDLQHSNASSPASPEKSETQNHQSENSSAATSSSLYDDDLLAIDLLGNRPESAPKSKSNSAEKVLDIEIVYNEKGEQEIRQVYVVKKAVDEDSKSKQYFEQIMKDRAQRKAREMSDEEYNTRLSALKQQTSAQILDEMEVEDDALLTTEQKKDRELQRKVVKAAMKINETFQQADNDLLAQLRYSNCKKINFVSTELSKLQKSILQHTKETQNVKSVVYQSKAQFEKWDEDFKTTVKSTTVTIETLEVQISSRSVHLARRLPTYDPSCLTLLLNHVIYDEDFSVASFCYDILEEINAFKNERMINTIQHMLTWKQFDAYFLHYGINVAQNVNHLTPEPPLPTPVATTERPLHPNIILLFGLLKQAITQLDKDTFFGTSDEKEQSKAVETIFTWLVLWLVPNELEVLEKVPDILCQLLHLIDQQLVEQLVEPLADRLLKALQSVDTIQAFNMCIGFNRTNQLEDIFYRACTRYVQMRFKCEAVPVDYSSAESLREFFTICFEQLLSDAKELSKIRDESRKKQELIAEVNRGLVEFYWSTVLLYMNVIIECKANDQLWETRLITSTSQASLAEDSTKAASATAFSKTISSYLTSIQREMQDFSVMNVLALVVRHMLSLFHVHLELQCVPPSSLDFSDIVQISEMPFAKKRRQTTLDFATETSKF